ncbi:MAG: DUF2284 domain-containing protein [Clostridia bacterium]|nr:DUF2284 domain-containing protein [Clostridia bacterium]
MDIERLKEVGLKYGFTHVANLDVSTIQLQDAVRDMCSANQCGKYGKNWSCPPGCGSLDECRSRVSQYTDGILVQTVGELDDPFDFEGMMAAEALHKENFMRMYDELRAEYPNMLPLGVGCCTRCKECTYPDAPCRLPDERISSMESYGMMVMQVCKDNGIGYYYGSDKVSYSSCFLFK